MFPSLLLPRSYFVLIAFPGVLVARISSASSKRSLLGCACRAVRRTVCGYGRIVYVRKQYRKWALPVRLRVTTVSVPCGRITGDTSSLVSQTNIKVRHFVDSIHYWSDRLIVTSYCQIWACPYICRTNTAVLSHSDGTVMGSVLRLWRTALQPMLSPMLNPTTCNNLPFHTSIPTPGIASQVLWYQSTRRRVVGWWDYESRR
jgi:hypothetical protein